MKPRTKRVTVTLGVMSCTAGVLFSINGAVTRNPLVIGISAALAIGGVLLIAIAWD